jgi:hypothetical protein
MVIASMSGPASGMLLLASIVCLYLSALPVERPAAAGSGSAWRFTAICLAMARIFGVPLYARVSRARAQREHRSRNQDREHESS